ncbi:MAG: tRNA dimethylallyltransferase, partial [Patescibacteria group bacterium]
QALVDAMIFPDVPPNRELRAKLEQKTTAELCRILRKVDGRRFSEIDKNNPRRLVRAIEIAKTLGKVPKIKKIADLYNPLFIGLVLGNVELKKKIKHRLDSRLRQGMIAEVRRLHKDGVSWKRLKSFGLEYRAIADFLQNRGGKNKGKREMAAKLERNIWQFAKRQMAWFKRDKRIRWFNPQNPKEWLAIKRAAQKFLADSN